MSNNAEAENGCRLNTRAAELVGINKVNQIETVQNPACKLSSRHNRFRVGRQTELRRLHYVHF
jgi:hypothetical protein